MLRHYLLHDYLYKYTAKQISIKLHLGLKLLGDAILSSNFTNFEQHWLVHDYQFFYTNKYIIINSQKKQFYLMGAMTFRIMTFCIMIFSIMTLSLMTLSIMTLSIIVECCYVECHLCCQLSWVLQRGLLFWVSLCWMSLCWVSWRHLLKEPWTRLTWRVNHSNPEFGIFFFQLHLLNVTPQFIANVFWTENIIKINKHVYIYIYTYIYSYVHVRYIYIHTYIIYVCVCVCV
jgi:hypothetical protein